MKPASLLALVLVACSSDAPTELPPPDPQAGLEEVVMALDEAVRLDREGRDDDARHAWRRAHLQFETNMEPALREVTPARDLAALEYRLGWIRTQIDQARGKPEPAVETLLEELRERVDRLEAI